LATAHAHKGQVSATYLKKKLARAASENAADARTPTEMRTPNELTIRLPAALLLSLSTMSALRSVSLHALVVQIVEASIAEFRLQNVPDNFLGRAKGPQIRKNSTNDDNHKSKVGPTLRKRIVDLLDEGLPVNQIAERSSISASTVRRIQNAQENGDEA
jgi:Homeodomain-like domain-containing protein